MSEALTVTAYFGEGDRVGGSLVSDVLADLAGRRRLRVAVLLRGTEGFGLTQVVRTQRLLTMSENAPLVWTAVDDPERIEAALGEIAGAVGAGGLVTLERSRLGARPAELAASGPGKLTLFPGRRAEVGDRRAAEALVDVLRAAGMEGASVLVGLDGTLEGERHRARFVGRNAGVPLMIVAAGGEEACGRALAALPGAGPLACTLERVRVLKRDGHRLDAPRVVPDVDPAGMGLWQKVTVHTRQRDRSGGRPLHLDLVRRLRRAGAPGATVLRGAWGYRGAERPRGDGPLALGAHRGPLVTVLVDRPAGVRRWWPIVDEVTARAGLVTGEIVPAFRATAGAAVVGGLGLATGDAASA